MDLVLLVLRLPDGSGLYLLRKIGETSIDTAVVVLSGDLECQTAQEALAAERWATSPRPSPAKTSPAPWGWCWPTPMALQTRFSTVPQATARWPLACKAGAASPAEFDLTSAALLQN